MKPKSQKTKEREPTKRQAKITLYVDLNIVKEFKKLAIDKGMSFSALGQKAFQAFLKAEKNQS